MLRLAGLTLLLLALGAPARAETTICTEITAVPYAITAPGIYCLKTSISTTIGIANAIVVGADNVVIDLNGNILDGSPAGPSTNAIGVGAFNRKHVIVRNGTIRGFRDGISLSGTPCGANSEGYVVERMRLEHNNWHGAFLDGKGSIVRNNTVVGTGNGMGMPNSSDSPRGLWVCGDYSHVSDNEVLETVETPGGVAHGIMVPRAIGVVVERNVISNSKFGPTGSFGINLGGILNTAVGNRVANMRFGLIFNGSGLYMDNTVGGATTPFSGGTAAGTTNYSF